MIRRIEDAKLNRYTFDNLRAIPGLVHGVFTRHGGVSKPPYASLNVGWSNGDSRAAVRENLCRVKEALKLNFLISSPQVHGDGISDVGEEALKTAKNRFPTLITPPADALTTQLAGIGLLVKIADCQAVLLVDPDRQVVANVHVGWRGSVNQILIKVIRRLELRYRCQPGNLIAAVSPSLGPCCAEFRNYRKELPPAFWPFQKRPGYFDFWKITERQLMEAGLKAGNIEFAGRCTVCESKDFFSYRAEGTTGRLAAVIGWE